MPIAKKSGQRMPDDVFKKEKKMIIQKIAVLLKFLTTKLENEIYNNDAITLTIYSFFFLYDITVNT